LHRESIVVTFARATKDRLGKDIIAGSLVGIRRLAMDFYATLYRFYSGDATELPRAQIRVYDVD